MSYSVTSVTTERDHENVGDTSQNSSPNKATLATAAAFHQTSQTFPCWNLDLLMSAFQLQTATETADSLILDTWKNLFQHQIMALILMNRGLWYPQLFGCERVGRKTS